MVDSESIFALYDDLAVEVVSDDSPNDDVELIFTNRELSEKICEKMGWEDFDLFETHDFEIAQERAVADECLAYAFISFLRYRLFTRASEGRVGVEAFNQSAAAYSEFWYIKLVEQWNELSDGTPMKAWMN